MSNFGRPLIVLNALLALTLVGSSQWTPAQPVAGVGLSDRLVPISAAGYTSAGDDDIPQSERAALPGAKLLSRSYTTSNGGAPIDFTVVEGTNRTALHDPRYCLTGAGWQLSADHTEPLSTSDDTSIDVCRAATQIGQPPDVTVAYLYVIGHRVISSPTEIRTALLWSAVFGRDSTPIYFLRFVQPLAADRQGEDVNHASLIAFASQMERAVAAERETGSENVVRSQGARSGVERLAN